MEEGGPLEASCLNDLSSLLTLYLYGTKVTGRATGIDIKHIATCQGKLDGATAVGDLVVCAPFLSDQVMGYDTKTGTATGVDIQHTATDQRKFSCMSALTSLRYLDLRFPQTQASALIKGGQTMVYDARTGRTTGIIIRHIATGQRKVRVVTAAGSLVVFAPFFSDQLIVYDTEIGRATENDIKHIATDQHKSSGVTAVSDVGPLRGPAAGPGGPQRRAARPAL